MLEPEVPSTVAAAGRSRAGREVKAAARRPATTAGQRGTWELPAKPIIDRASADGGGSGFDCQVGVPVRFAVERVGIGVSSLPPV